MAKPIVAIVGRPNVGKSTLFNKLSGKRLAIVDDRPGVTRDRLYADCEWLNQKFLIVDTGGIEPYSDDIILSQMRRQAQIAIETADAIIFVCDVKTGVVATDAEVASMLLKSGKPIVLCVNKCDALGAVPADFYEFYNLGLGDPVAVSSVHGHGTGDLLDEVLKHLPEPEVEDEEDDTIKVALIGKPNVGKSSLLNFLAREDRAIVTDIAGTTRDVIEETVNIDGVPLILTDTAGIRQTDDVVEKIGVQKSKKSIDEADLVIVVLDASSPLDSEELSLLKETENKKRIIVINKADIKDEAIIKSLHKIDGIDPVELSLKTGQGAELLTEKIKNMYNLGQVGHDDNCIITNLRHVDVLQRASLALSRAIESINHGMPSDIASIDINIAIDALGEITGAIVSEDIVSAIFHSFCVGK